MNTTTTLHTGELERAYVFTVKVTGRQWTGTYFGTCETIADDIEEELHRYGLKLSDVTICETQSKHTLAKLFSDGLLATIGSDKLAEVNTLNAVEPNPSICHSHSFCDPNEVMLQAWVDLFGSEMDCQSDEQCALWDAAWNIAKRNNFNL